MWPRKPCAANCVAFSTPEDFAQDVLASFFRGTIRRRDFDDLEHLVRFVLVCTRHEVAGRNRHFLHSGRTGLARAEHLSADAVDQRQTSALASLQAEEAWQQLLSRFSPSNGRILDLLRDGYTHSDIAVTLGVNEKTIRRTVSKLAEELATLA